MESIGVVSHRGQPWKGFVVLAWGFNPGNALSRGNGLARPHQDASNSSIAAYHWSPVSGT
jgi:hypothetical protein